MWRGALPALAPLRPGGPGVWGGRCTAIDVDILTSRRAEPDSFQVRAAADKVRDVTATG